MTVAELNSVLDLKALIDSQRAKLEDLKICSGITASKVSGLPKTQALTSTTETVATKIIETEACITTLESKLTATQAELVTKLTAALKDKSALWRSVLVRRYCAGLTFKAIAAQIGYTVDYVQLLHRQAAAFVTNGQWRPSRRRSRQSRQGTG